MTEVILRPLLEALVQGLESEPRVASNVCWAFNSLAEAAYEAAEAAAAGTNGFDGMGGNDDGTPQTYALSPFFEPIVQKLLAATDRYVHLIFRVSLQQTTEAKTAYSLGLMLQTPT